MGFSLGGLNPLNLVKHGANSLVDLAHGKFGASIDEGANVFSPIGSQYLTRNILRLNKPGDDNQGTVNAYGIDSNSKTYASDTNAAIAAQQWGNYQHDFQPLESYLSGFVNNPGYQKAQEDQNLASFNKQNEMNQGTMQRNLDRYGLSLSPDQQQSQQRQFNTQTSLGRVEAINRTKAAMQAQEYSILGAGTQPQIQTSQGLGIQVG